MANLPLPQPPKLDLDSLPCDPKTGLPMLKGWRGSGGLAALKQQIVGEFNKAILNVQNLIRSNIQKIANMLSPEALAARLANLIDELTGGVLTQVEEAIKAARSLLRKMPTSLADATGMLMEGLGLCSRERMSGAEEYKKMQQAQSRARGTQQYLSEAASVNSSISSDISNETDTMSPKKRKSLWSLPDAALGLAQDTTSKVKENLMIRSTDMANNPDPNLKTVQSTLQGRSLEVSYSPQPMSLKRR